MKRKTYELRLDEIELRYLMVLIDQGEEALLHSRNLSKVLYQSDSQIKSKIKKIISEHIELQTFFTKKPENNESKSKFNHWT